ncbi:hypothetical protein JW898_05410 [Candidatus Woesearchaeota archaeon]|nr:hypothetical protein [Candidatus Woesearchaeota archaeon]
MAKAILFLIICHLCFGAGRHSFIGVKACLRSLSKICWYFPQQKLLIYVFLRLINFSEKNPDVFRREIDYFVFVQRRHRLSVGKQEMAETSHITGYMWPGASLLWLVLRVFAGKAG